MIRRALALVLSALCAASLAGCEARNDADYRGEITATVSGSVTNEAGLTMQSPEISLAWGVSSGSPDYVEFERIPVTGAFPASFSLELHGPPPDSALNTPEQTSGEPRNVRFGVAQIVVLPRGYDEPPAGPWGKADHMLAYVDEDVVPGSGVEALFSGPLTRGYHVIRVVYMDEAWGVDECVAAVKAVNPAAVDAAVARRCEYKLWDILVEAPEGLGTPVDISIKTEHKPVNWT